jgi:hypothetical protein
MARKTAGGRRYTSEFKEVSDQRLLRDISPLP